MDVTTRPGYRPWAGLLLSVLLHALVVWGLIGFPGPERTPPEPEALPVDLVTEPEVKAPPKPEPPPEIPTPIPDEKPELAPIKPQLTPGRLEKASTPGAEKPAAEKSVDRQPGGLGPAPDAEEAQIGKRGEATQTERDVLLAQILPFWRPPSEIMAADPVMHVRVLLRADGSLGPPFTYTMAWNPAGAIDGYDKIPPNDPRRRSMETFYVALRMAQPLNLPPELKAKAPLWIVLDFRFRDVP